MRIEYLKNNKKIYWHSNWIFQNAITLKQKMNGKQRIINNQIFCKMKTKINFVTFLAIFFAANLFAQDRTTVSATNFEISDNLDLRAVASIFGESDNLEDFERQLNDPRIRISNLDLNNDNRVDYLRVIESVDYRTHLIIIQAVLGRDIFQDVATIEVEKNRYNQVQVQVVGNVFMYGPNYIYEPVYAYTPFIYATFWVNHYRPYCSTWYWNYYPTYYYTWNPCPVYRYQNNVNIYVNYNNQYNYVNYRNSKRAVALYETRRANYYETQYPNRSFTSRNANAKNRYELDQTRTVRNTSVRSDVAYDNPKSSSAVKTDRSKPVNYAEASAPRRTVTRQNTTENMDRSKPVNYAETSTPRRTATRQNASENNAPQREKAQGRNHYPSEKSDQKVSRAMPSTRTESPRVAAVENNNATRGNSHSGRTNTGRNN